MWFIGEIAHAYHRKVTPAKDWDRSSLKILKLATLAVPVGVIVGFTDVGHIHTEGNFLGAIGFALMLAGISIRWVAIHTLGRYFTRTVTVMDGPDAGRSAATDAGGMYMLTAITTGSFSLRATRNDFETQTVPVSLTRDSSVDFTLKLVTNVSGFFGTYNTTLSIAQQSCEFPFTVGPTGTVNLNGRSDGSGLTVTIVERGTTRTYGGTLRGDGSFSGGGGGVIAGITTGQRNHEYTGDVSGSVSGRNINVTENVLFSIPCPGKTMKIVYSGSR